MNIKVTGGYDKSNCTTTETSEPINFNKEHVAISSTKNEYDIGCYYEFSDYKDFRQSYILQLSHTPDESIFPYHARLNGILDAFKYIRPLTAKAGEIRKPKLLIGFVNVDEDGVVSIEPTRHKADEFANNDRIACIDLSQFNEGEGL